MKLFSNITAVTGLLAVSLVYLSCTRDIPNVAAVTPGNGNAATMQVFNATVRASRNYVYLDGTPVSGIVFAYGGVFPATAYSFKVPAGQRAIWVKDTLPTTTQTAITFSLVAETGKSYTVFTYDTITSAKQLTVTNNIAGPIDSAAMLRFGNFIYNTTAVPAVDVYSFRKGNAAPVFTNIATVQVTDFIRYPSGQTDTLYVYATGTTSPLLVKQLVPSLTPGRSYTSVYNGSYKGTKQISTFATY